MPRVHPHAVCPHVDPSEPCLGSHCLFCDVEPLAEFWNRKERAAEGSGRKVVRRVACLMDKWPGQRAEIAQAALEVA